MEKPECKVKPQELPGKRRVAHEARHAEVLYMLHTDVMANPNLI